MSGKYKRTYSVDQVMHYVLDDDSDLEGLDIPDSEPEYNDD